MSSNGRTPDFDSEDRGSNPCVETSCIHMALSSNRQDAGLKIRRWPFESAWGHILLEGAPNGKAPDC